MHFEDDFPYLSSEVTLQPSPWLSLSRLVASSVRAATSLKVCVSFLGRRKISTAMRKTPSSSTQKLTCSFSYTPEVWHIQWEKLESDVSCRRKGSSSNQSPFFGGELAVKLQGCFVCWNLCHQKSEKNLTFLVKRILAASPDFFSDLFRLQFCPSGNSNHPRKKKTLWGCQEDNFNQLTLLLKNLGFSIFQKETDESTSQLPSTSRFPLPKKVHGEKSRPLSGYQLAYRGGRAPIRCSCWGSD